MGIEPVGMVDAISALTRLGYDRNYRIENRYLHDTKTGSSIPTGDIQVDESIQFQSELEAADDSNLYAISDRGTGGKGLLIDAFDMLEEHCSQELFDLLKKDRRTFTSDNRQIALRYGLRKIFKKEFDENPHRFILRTGFPDFPECPFGQSFTMLGFDTEKQDYVWLATSILKDQRLIKIAYRD